LSFFLTLVDDINDSLSDDGATLLHILFRDVERRDESVIEAKQKLALKIVEELK